MTILIYSATCFSRNIILLKPRNVQYSVCSHHVSSREDYQALGLSEDATKEQIKAAYFLKAKQFHPDNMTR